MPDAITVNFTAVAARFTSAMGQFAQRVRTEGAKTVQAQMANTRQVIVATTPVETGFLQAHWGPVEEASMGELIAYRVANPTEYGPILEYGGYRRVGPRTVALGGGDLGGGFQAESGIYSQQAPLGWVRKALAGAWPQLRLRLQNMVRQAWPYAMGPGGAPGPEALPFLGDIEAIFGIDVVGGIQTAGLSPSAQRLVGGVMRELRGRRRGRRG